MGDSIDMTEHEEPMPERADGFTRRETRHDPVTAPSHYRVGGIDCLDFIEAKQLGYREGNVVKYVVRAKHKGNELEDLRKARFYLDRVIAELEASK
jgi:hypothetical protein